MGRQNARRADGFNPHPPLLAGETSIPQAARKGHSHVSIHTRHYWRVKRHQQSAGQLRSGFQSTPAITGG